MSGKKGKPKNKSNANGKTKTEKKPDPYAYHRQLTEEEKKMVDEMRKRLGDSEFKDTHKGEDVGEILRFLKARDFDYNKAMDMLTAHYKWRAEHKPAEADPSTFKAEYATRKFRVMPLDKEGHPTIVLCASKHLPGANPLEETIKYGIYTVEKALKMLPPGQEKINIIYDRRGFARKNFDKNLITSFAGALEANYPERVANILVYQSDWVFNLLFKIVRPFMPAETVKKIHILNTSDLKGEMLQYYDSKNLWHRHGGEWHDEDSNSSEGGEEGIKKASSEEDEAMKKELESSN